VYNEKVRGNMVTVGEDSESQLGLPKGALNEDGTMS